MPKNLSLGSKRVRSYRHPSPLHATVGVMVSGLGSVPGTLDGLATRVAARRATRCSRRRCLAQSRCSACNARRRYIIYYICVVIVVAWWPRRAPRVVYLDSPVARWNPHGAHLSTRVRASTGRVSTRTWLLEALSARLNILRVLSLV